MERQELNELKKKLENLSYILKLRNSLIPEFRHMPLFQNGSAIIVVNENGEILLQERGDRNLWGLPGGLQELGETFEQVALRELQEETGLVAFADDLELVKVVSGESRKNSYPNGDQVYNNTVLFCVKKYHGDLNGEYAELVDNNDGNFILQKETKTVKFFGLDNLPENLMDIDLIESYRNYATSKQR